MRIILDTNIFISAALFPTPKMNSIFEKISQNHTLVVCSYILDELYDVAKRKFPFKIRTIEKMLSKMSYELVYTPKNIEENLFEIRDIKDYPILYTAIKEDIDILISGDKDFFDIDFDIDIKRPKILTPSEFLLKY